MKSTYKKKKEHYKNKVESFVPKNGEYFVRYRDGEQSEIVNLEQGSVQIWRATEI